ncbi:hypothetical protein F441_02151 [Phytophthora nicotianae CJ01A1]|uniref:Uncharacterized protein n=1 Tax=Phytophthora nicotianae CJ01A1 TaxID=1317063 RepID=W2XQG6_PHYNI|nr:hypothetical protein F441_02151 [Phytophthora nicotianae CJ01A1]
MPRVAHATDDKENTSLDDVCYQIVAWNYNLPAFDPVPMIKTAVLSPSSVKKFNRILIAIRPYIGPITCIGLAIRFAAFAAPANVGRVLAPISVLLHLIGLITTSAQLRTEYIKIILRTFDFWFLQAANTIWVIVMSATMNDLRVVLVVFCWADFTGWLLQETYLRNSNAVVAVALFEWVFYVLLMVQIVLDLVDEIHHYALITACGRTLSTKDVLVNVIGTMTMLSLRNLWRRYQLVKRHKPGTAMKAPGYRSRIALSPSGPLVISLRNSTIQSQDLAVRSMTKASSKPTKLNKRPLLQLRLSAQGGRFDPSDTMWTRIGSLSRMEPWKIAVLYLCGTLSGAFATLSMFLTENEFVAVIALVTSAVFSGVYTCCCQRQLFLQILTSFHFIFLYTQIVAIGLCVVDMFNWNWVPVCGVGSSLFLTFTVLTIDALTPIMKRRLCFSYWFVIAAVGLFLTVHLAFLLDVLVLGHWALQDRVFLTIDLLGQQVAFYVVPTLLSRVITVLVWSGRFVYVAITRSDDNALVLLRGDVEFDYEGWQKQTRFNDL